MSMSQPPAPESQVIADAKQLLLHRLIGLGGHAGNTRLMAELQWSPDRYWPIRNRLLDDGRITRGRGRGGSVEIVPDKAPTQTSSQVAAIENDKYIGEESLYDPITKVLQDNWTSDYRYRESIVEITARQGRKETGGVWSRPDITVVGMSTYHYLPGRYFDVSTFEVKSKASLDVTGVFEALAHRRASTRAYAIYHVPGYQDEDDPRQKRVDAICAEAKKHGIGVILADDPEKYETWDEVVEAARINPNPEDLNDFIAVQLSEPTKAEIVQWFK